MWYRCSVDEYIEGERKMKVVQVQRMRTRKRKVKLMHKKGRKVV